MLSTQYIMLLASLVPKPVEKIAAKQRAAEQFPANRKDFWNDPQRWEGIADPMQDMFWMVRRPDRIEI